MLIDNHWSFVMNRKLIAALLAASATVSIPAFASGYGPAPFYKPSVGAPASQRGQSQLTVAAERAEAEKGASDASYGGAEQSVSESGARQVAPNQR
jgi:hypothetical protein